MKTHLKAKIQGAAVVYGRTRKGMKRTADRLAKCNVDSAVNSIYSQLTPLAMALPDDEIIDACAKRLWVEFCTTELNLQTSNDK